MIQSMTGYGKKTIELPAKKINIEIKSLNSKALDLSTRIAPAYREKEIEIRKLLSKTLLRGKVDFSLWVEKDNSESTTKINASIAQNYFEQIIQLKNTLGLSADNNAELVSDIIRMPDVLSKEELEELDEEEWKVILEGIIEASTNLSEFREQEGIALSKKFNKNITKIGELLEQVEPYEKERIEKIKNRITEALEKTLNIDYDKNRLEQELIFYIEKLDINEEKQRLSNHLKYFVDTMNDHEGQGKKLGFISQEMGREINTLGSKSNHAEMQKIVVQMKDELEQIKEQVLNVL